MRIAVYGASGFTGGLAVAEVRRRGLTPVLVGRDPRRLRAAAERTGAQDDGEAAIRVADLADPAGLAAAFADCDAVVNTAGPFTLWGPPVVRAAIAAGVPYVDTTGEQAYIQGVFDTFGKEAEHAGVGVVPAMADDGGPGDLIAALTAARVAPVDELLIADLRQPGHASRGTVRSMLAINDEPGLEYRDGGWEPATGPGPGSVRLPDSGTLPEGGGSVPVAAFALPGVATVPRHVTARRVSGAFRAELAAAFGALTAEAVDSVPETVPDEARRAARWLMVAEATGRDGGRATGWATGPDGYGLTAVIAVEAALRLAAPGAPTGVLAPAQAFDPTDFLDALAPHGVTWGVA